MPASINGKIVTLEILKTAYDNLIGVLTRHIESDENPHGVTAELVGAVPIGVKINGVELNDEDITLPVDDELDADSENPVQNKVIKAALDDINAIASCTVADKGKFLVVNDDGEPEWLSIVSAENERF